MEKSPYFAQSNFSPLSQVVDPATESGATIFLDQNDDDESAPSLVVACRGSANLKNFATNLNFKLVPSNKLPGSPQNGNVHNGFQQAASGLWEYLAPELDAALRKMLESREKNKPGTKIAHIPITFTGHSLGAATALLCAVLHAQRSEEDQVPQRVSDVTTFGGPLLCDATLAEYITEQALRHCKITHLVHSADPVLANNKPLWDQLGFVNTGTELQCDPYSTTVYNKSEPSSLLSDGKKVAWNILDHCNYLGVFMGPRLI
eukprot:CAMPEP_0194204570 /NCGR_PEP_ID=MMETSP0156-20130528/4053_1 /TAXON_ID=33649 /ORGANISM="Thalassionema nitzschioides, Strain L26-B" /LENGTH=260 /DNA_ID=CAMNT_0038930615 /DNA_START=126 /DNA_END=908 /DNA_ORIENTATION=+